MFEIIKNTFFKGKKDQNHNQNQQQNKEHFSDKINKVSGFLASKYKDIIDEVKTIRSKLKNLSEVNYNLGLRHLENGNLSDAVFRFKFINKIWPENQDAYYYLAYCLYLKKQNNKARQKLEELLKINPNYDSKAAKLLEKIDNNIPPS